LFGFGKDAKAHVIWTLFFCFSSVMLQRGWIASELKSCWLVDYIVNIPSLVVKRSFFNLPFCTL
jgi:hypothetical protein